MVDITANIAQSIEVAPVRERGLKLRIRPQLEFLQMVAPVRERGLKYYDDFTAHEHRESLP